MMDDVIVTYEFTREIGSPTAGEVYTLSNDILNPFELVSVSYNHKVSSGSATSQFDVLKNSTALSEYGNLATVDSQVTKTTGTVGLAENQFAAGDTFEISLDSVGANTDYLVITFHCKVL
jgi:hypothetical protein